MTIKFVSLISKDDTPLYIQSFEPQTPENAEEFLRYNFFSHMALDIFVLPASMAIREQNSSSDQDPLLLFIQDDISVYGFETNTNLKIVVGFDGAVQTPGRLAGVFASIQRAYLRVICNPFAGDINSPINTPSFDTAIKKIVNLIENVKTGELKQ